MYWLGWSLRRFFLTIGLAVLVTAICVVITIPTKIAVLACSGVLAAPILVHSAAMCFWFKGRTISECWGQISRFLQIVEVIAVAVFCSLGSTIVSFGHMADIFGQSNGTEVPILSILLIEGAVGGICFWVLFGCLSSSIGSRGNEELRHYLEEWLGALAEIKPRLMEKQKNMRVFVSYVRENLEAVRRICAYLEGEDFKVVWDQNLRPGQNWKEELTQGILQAGAVIVCFSAESEQREESEFYAEIRDSVGKARKVKPGAVFLIPVRLSLCAIPAIRIDSNTTIDSLQRVDLFPESQWLNGLQLVTETLRSKPSPSLL